MIVYLEPQSPFTNSPPRSDTLFGAICWAIRLLYSEAQLSQLLQQFDRAFVEGQPLPFVISSLFPYFQDQQGRILLVPRPLLAPGSLIINDANGYGIFKRLRKVGYLSQAVFTDLITGRLEETAIFKGLAGNNSKFSIYGNALVTTAENQRLKLLPNLLGSSEAARNTINRISGSTAAEEGGALFYQTITATTRSTTHPAHSGLYLAIKIANEDAAITGMLKAALYFLAEKGLGGDSSIGRGYCRVDFDDQTNIAEDPTGERLMTLSLLHPAAADIAHLRNNQSVTYARIERRKGFIESGYIDEVKQVWKPTVIMLTEGATFPRDGARSNYGSLFTDPNQRAGQNFALRINGLAYTVAMKGDAQQ